MGSWKALLLAVLSAATSVDSLPSSPSYATKERHIVPRGWTAVGDASKSQLLNLQIGLKQRNEGLIERHLIEVSDPSHARYGQHLSAAEIHDMIAPSNETLILVTEWLAEHHVENFTYTSPARDWITVLVPIEKAEELLQTEYKTFRHSDGSEISRAPEWSLPLHLHEHIDVVQPTTSFFRPIGQAKRFGPVKGDDSWPMSWWTEVGQYMYADQRPSGDHAAQVAAVCNASFTTPTCLRTLYGTIDYTPKTPGKNRVGINNYLNQTNYRKDIELFLKTFRPEAVAAATEFDIVIIANAPNDQGPYNEYQIEHEHNFEGNLDSELVLSITWPTPMTAFSTGGQPPYIPDMATTSDTNEPYLTWINYALAQSDLPQTISSSYGDDEQTVPESYAKRVCSGFAQLGARGISLIVSSGDAGVGPDGDCFSNTDGKHTFLPAFPTSCPWVTSVGATANFNPETAVTRFGSGAGFSNYFGAPAYQKPTVDAYIASLNGLYNGLYNKSGRGYPDVAAQGNHDAVVWVGNITTVGGTSASSPTFASVISLVNDALIAAGKQPLGFLNPWIYGGAHKALTDITIGSSIGCNVAGFPAKKGWDAVTGWGTPNFKELVAAAFKKEGGGGWTR